VATIDSRQIRDTNRKHYRGARVAVVIPAYNEAPSIAKVIEAIPDWVDQIVVGDNGSTDDTAAIAEAAGATVVHEPETGYGAACLRAIAALDAPDIVVFIDADFSDDPTEMNRLVDPILDGQAEIVIGSRTLGNAEPGSLSPQQRYGNRLACALIRLFWQTRYTDLGPFRAIRYATLCEIEMQDRNWGWTVEMQVRAAQQRLPVIEVPVTYRKRIGRSKISGTVGGVLKAGSKILYCIFRELLAPRRVPTTITERLCVFTRYPIPGETKTRLIPELGPEGAATLQREMTAFTMQTARRTCQAEWRQLEVHYTGADEPSMRGWLGPDADYVAQAGGDLGERMYFAVHRSLDRGSERVVVVGTDCPELNGGQIRQAFALLRTHDLVLGPSEDGGYYLIGLSKPIADLFVDIDWGTDTVFDRTIEIAKRCELQIALLPKLRDVDVPEDLPVWRQTIENVRGAGDAPKLSVIIPTLNEAEYLPATLAAVTAQPGVEAIVADGGSKDRTRSLAATYGARVVRSEPGRAKQLNAGAADARSDTLLFLHADTIVPPAYLEAITVTLNQPNTVAGAFRLGIAAEGFKLRAIEIAANRRSRHRQMPYGDQGLFVRRKAFEKFPEIAVMEDYEWVRALKRKGRIALTEKWAATSARRWQKAGPWRLVLRHQLIIWGYRLGVAPEQLARLRS
jgi:uncharacterized protein